MHGCSLHKLLTCALCAHNGDANTIARRIVIAGGGTGGHLFPGITIAREFMTRNMKNSVLFVSTANPFERSTLARAGFPLRKIKVAGIKGKSRWQKLTSLLLIPVAVMQAVWILMTFKPALVVGVGSYAAGPVVLAAWLMRKRIVLHEQNILPGITNRVLARFANRIYVSFENTAGNFESRKVRITGNPVRHEIINQSAASSAGGYDQTADHRPLNVLITGGSQGAHSINMTMIGALPHLKVKEQLDIVHQTGADDEAAVKNAYQDHGIRGTVRAFFDDMDQRYQQADLIICRAGATTVAEVTAIGKGVIFVPFPFAADNHQVLNARALEAAGAAEMIEQKDLTPEILADRIDRYQTDRQALTQMARKAGTFGKPQAARVIVDDMCELIEG
jgi:UDP-N-acetylglucosamine--N-acetylmuramyl-(pentapeptide) pyrophosphoryl-undecaprenol N-acetylglucosamine transferase